MNDPIDPTETREERAFHGPDARGPQGEPVKPAAQARQGLSTSRTLMVLIAGVALVAVAIAASYVGAV